MSTKIYYLLELFIPDLINGGFRQFAFNSSGMAGKLNGLTSFGVFEAQTLEVSRSTESKEYEFFLVWNDDNVTTPYRGLLTSSRVSQQTYIRYTVVIDGVERVLLYGSVLKYKFNEKGIYLIVTSFINKLAYGKVVSTSSNCRWDFGDEFCQFDLTTVQSTFTIDVIAPDRFSLTTTTPMVAAEFNDGFLTFNASDIRFDVSYNNDDTVLMFDEVPGVITSGMTFTITQGCNKTVNTCLGYNNLERFGGIPNGIRYAPSSLRALSGAKDIS